ncbi:MAG: 4a-hydroxytetrahydrobiopterin dehydratase [Chloroflexi bacterium]|nr:4a-hydroxytetrahydrobiopterin dehydratase [Chloroflexota bacterium]MQC27947.1 4a-hydroxytetrahydrobiopterin dehydratase [Chloroflexota bacterium]
MAKKLSDDAITSGLTALSGWSRDGETIARQFEFSDFVAALGFITQVGVLAERANHHPELTNVYNRVRVALSTHDAGGITQKDFDLAREISERA